MAPGAYAHQVYGGTPAMQPTPSPVPGHLGHPEPMARTVPRSSLGALGNPTLVLVAVLGLAALLINFSVRFEVSG